MFSSYISFTCVTQISSAAATKGAELIVADTFHPRHPPNSLPPSSRCLNSPQTAMINSNQRHFSCNWSTAAMQQSHFESIMVVCDCDWTPAIISTRHNRYKSTANVSKSFPIAQIHLQMPQIDPKLAHNVLKWMLSVPKQSLFVSDASNHHKSSLFQFKQPDNHIANL